MPGLQQTRHPAAHQAWGGGGGGCCLHGRLAGDPGPRGGAAWGSGEGTAPTQVSECAGQSGGRQVAPAHGGGAGRGQGHPGEGVARGGAEGRAFWPTAGTRQLLAGPGAGRPASSNAERASASVLSPEAAALTNAAVRTLGRPVSATNGREGVRRGACARLFPGSTRRRGGRRLCAVPGTGTTARVGSEGGAARPSAGPGALLARGPRAPCPPLSPACSCPCIWIPEGERE